MRVTDSANLLSVRADNLTRSRREDLPSSLFHRRQRLVVVRRGRKLAIGPTKASSSHAQGTFALFFPPQILTLVGRSACLTNAPPVWPAALRVDGDASARQRQRTRDANFI